MCTSNPTAQWQSRTFPPTDQTEFYQLLTYTDDVDLTAKLKAWENFYKYDRPHVSLDGKTPYEVMKSLLE